MSKTWWKSGDWNAICDVCGHKYKASQLKKRWDGLMVCDEDWETRHPQEFIRPIKDMQKLPFTRPRGDIQTLLSATVTDVSGKIIPGQPYTPGGPFVSGFRCTTFTIQGVADYGTADCAKADNDLKNRLPIDPLGP